MNLSSIPECLLQSANKNLKELYLGNPATKASSIEENVFWKVPECPSSLVVLDLSYVKLSGLSECNWANLSNLKQFVAKGNVSLAYDDYTYAILYFNLSVASLQDLFWPPDDFISLQSLEICDLSSSKMYEAYKIFSVCWSL